MDIRNCPNCGSEDIEKSSGSKEYSSYVRWTCTSCAWSYQQGKGMGWYDTKGTHPRRISDSDQSRLTESGEWCSNCETVENPPHHCTARELVEQADEPLTQEEVCEELSEYHYNANTQIMDELGVDGIQLTPTFFRITTWDRAENDDMYRDPPKEAEIASSIRHELSVGGQMSAGELSSRLAAENKIETRFIRMVTEMMDDVKRDLRAGLLIDE